MLSTPISFVPSFVRRRKKTVRRGRPTYITIPGGKADPCHFVASASPPSTNANVYEVATPNPPSPFSQPGRCQRPFSCFAAGGLDTLAGAARPGRKRSFAWNRRAIPSTRSASTPKTKNHPPVTITWSMPARSPVRVPESTEPRATPPLLYPAGGVLGKCLAGRRNP